MAEQAVTAVVRSETSGTMLGTFGSIAGAAGLQQAAAMSGNVDGRVREAVVRILVQTALFQPQE